MGAGADADTDVDAAAAAQRGPILIYDGTCAFCNGLVQFILRHERRDTLRFATLAGDVGQRILERHPELHGVDSALWVEDGGARVLSRSEAALAVGRYLGGVWRFAAVARGLPRSWRDALYDFVARHRRALGSSEACRLPRPGDRARFLDPSSHAPEPTPSD